MNSRLRGMEFGVWLSKHKNLRVYAFGCVLGERDCVGEKENTMKSNLIPKNIKLVNF